MTPEPSFENLNDRIRRRIAREEVAAEAGSTFTQDQVEAMVRPWVEELFETEIAARSQERLTLLKRVMAEGFPPADQPPVQSLRRPPAPRSPQSEGGRDE